MTQPTSNRRPRGQGSVYQRKDGRWVASIREPATGKRRQKYAHTEKDAWQWLRKMQGRQDSGKPILDANARFRDYAEAWLTTRATRSRRESTVAAYRQRLETYVYPTIGDFKIANITADDVETMYDDLLKRGLSQQTIKGAKNALSAVLSHAVKAKHLVANEVGHAALPRGARKTAAVVPPTAEQVGALIDAADGTDLDTLILLLATTGVRVGEALGAQWQDIDLAAGTWKVSRTVTRSADGQMVLGEDTKSGDSRPLVLAPDLVVALRSQRKRLAAWQLQAGSAWTDNGLVFPSRAGTVWHINNLYKVFAPIKKKAGFPGSFHSLRHFNASVALSSVPLSVVSKTLGHKKASLTTDLYQHLLESDAGKVSLAVSLAVKSGRSNRQ